MFKNLLKVKGVKSLTKNEQKSVLGGQNDVLELLKCIDGKCQTQNPNTWCEISPGVRHYCG